MEVERSIPEATLDLTTGTRESSLILLRSNQGCAPCRCESFDAVCQSEGSPASPRELSGLDATFSQLRFLPLH